MTKHTIEIKDLTRRQLAIYSNKVEKWMNSLTCDFKINILKKIDKGTLFVKMIFNGDDKEQASREISILKKELNINK